MIAQTVPANEVSGDVALKQGWHALLTAAACQTLKLT